MRAMVSNTVCSQDFNGCTSGTPLPVNFPVLAITDIYLAKLLVGGETFINLTLGVDYDVTDLGGGAYEVNPLITLASEIIVKVFRMTEPTQPYSFPETGALPADQVEAMGDRLCMVEQETRLLAGIDGPAVTLPAGALLIRPTTTFANITARGNATPAFLGQVGVQLDTHAWYEGTTLAAGGWTLHGGGGTTYTAGDGLDLVSTTFSVDSTVIRETGTQTLTDKTIDAACILQYAETISIHEREQTLADGASIVWNIPDGGNAVVTLGGNRAMAAPSSTQDGSVYRLTVIQDGTGSRTLTWAAAFKWPSGSAPTLTATANRKDVFEFFCRSGVLYGRTFGLNYT